MGVVFGLRRGPERLTKAAITPMVFSDNFITASCLLAEDGTEKGALNAVAPI